MYYQKHRPQIKKSYIGYYSYFSRLLFCFGFSLVVIFGLESRDIQANPFSSKLPKPLENKPTILLDKLLFKGYAVNQNRIYGFIENDGESQIIQKGDRFSGMKVVGIKKQMLIIQYEGTIHHIKLISE